MKAWPGTFIAPWMMTMCYQFVWVVFCEEPIDPVDFKLLGASGKNPSKQPSNLTVLVQIVMWRWTGRHPKFLFVVYCSFSYVLRIYIGRIRVPFKKPRYFFSQRFSGGTRWLFLPLIHCRSAVGPRFFGLACKTIYSSSWWATHWIGCSRTHRSVSFFFAAQQHTHTHTNKESTLNIISSPIH